MRKEIYGALLAAVTVGVLACEPQKTELVPVPVGNQVVAVGVKAATKEATASPEPTKKPKKLIAIVDDDLEYRKSLSLLLGFDHKVMAFPSCAELLTLMAAGQKFDLYLLDTQLGEGETGMECETNIRTVDPAAAVVGMSATKDHEANFKRFFHKPEGPTVIKEIIKEVLVQRPKR